MYHSTVPQTAMTLQGIVLTLLMSVTIHSDVAESGNMSAQNRLLKGLLADYGFTSVRPVYNTSTSTTVQMRLTLTQVIELNEKQQTIEIGAWLNQRWTDEYMTWDPNDHEGVDHVYVHKSMIWLPDITLFKNVDRDFESYKAIPVIVKSNGEATLNTPAILKCTCLVDARLFPFDTQMCELRFTSWVYDVTSVNLTELGGVVDRKSYYTDVGVWELVNVTVVRSEKLYGGGAVFTELCFFIHLRRRPLFHVLQILLPCALLSLLNLMVFVLPPESGEKISLGVTNLLSLVLFQQLISGSVPPTSDKAPIIGYYFTPMIALACTSIVSTVAVLNVFYRDKRRPIPRWVRCVIFDILAKLVCHREQGQSSPNPARPRAEGECFLKLTDNPTDSSDPDPDETWPSNAPHHRGNGSHETLSSSVVRARKQARLTAKDMREERGAGAPSDPHTWREVALVMDRTALVLSSVITLVSIIGTLITFIVTFAELSY